MTYRNRLFLIRSFFIYFIFCLPLVEVTAWSPPLNITQDTNIDNARIALDGNGNGIAIWTIGEYPSLKVQSSTYNGTIWSQPVDLTAFGLYSNVKIKMNDAGNAVAIWTYSSGGNQEIQCRKLPVGGVWSPTLTISLAGYNEEPEIAINSSGDVFATWTSRTNDQILISRMPLFGSWIYPSVIASGGGNLIPNISLNDNGIALVSWYNQANSSLFSSTYSNQIWSTPVSIAGSKINNYDLINIRLDSLGNAIAIWNQSPSGYITASYQQFGGEWLTTPITVSNEIPNTTPKISIDNNGNAAAVWINFDLDGVEASIYTDNNWSAPVIISNSIGNQDPSVYVDPTGNVTAIWHSWDGGVIKSASLNAVGSTWSFPPADISDENTYNYAPYISGNSIGQLVLIWLSSDGVNISLQASIN